MKTTTTCNDDPIETVLGGGVAIERKGRYLFGLRLGALGHGTWGFPGGHVEAGEDPLACAARELLEETGLHLENARGTGWFSHIEGQRRYLTLYVTGDARGEPEVLEPTKCARWEWHGREALPEGHFVPTAGYFETAFRARAAA